MIKKITIFTICLAFLATIANADTWGSERALFFRRFSIMRQISSFCHSKNENTALSSLNNLRDMLFRSHFNPLGISIAREDSLSGLISRMNADVKKIYTGIMNLENSLKLSDPYDHQDKQLNELLRFLVVSEITMTLKDDYFLRISEKTRDFIQQARNTILALMSNTSSEDTLRNFHAMDALENLMNLTGYVYNEQVQWMMNTSYALQGLEIEAFKINNNSVFDGFKIKQPPVLFVNQTGEYNLR